MHCFAPGQGLIHRLHPLDLQRQSSHHGSQKHASEHQRFAHSPLRHPDYRGLVGLEIEQRLLYK